MNSFYCYNKKGEFQKYDNFSGFDHKSISENKSFWFDLIDAKKEDIEKLKDTLDLHPLSVEDCETFSELPKVEEFDNYLFIIFHKIYYDIKRDKLILKKINIFLGKNYIITIHKETYPAIESIKEKIKTNPSIMEKGPDFMLHMILDSIVDDYFPLIEYWEKEINKIEELIIHEKVSSHNFLLNKVIGLRKDLNELKRSIIPQTIVMTRLSREDAKFISKKTSFYFRDVNDHLLKIDSSLKNNSYLLMDLLDAYLSTVSNKMNENSNRMNLVMQKLTLISTIFLPLTFIASFYGMNFKYMPELSVPFAYPLIALFMIALACFLYFFFKKKHLL